MCCVRRHGRGALRGAVSARDDGAAGTTASDHVGADVIRVRGDVIRVAGDVIRMREDVIRVRGDVIRGCNLCEK